MRLRAPHVYSYILRVQASVLRNRHINSTSSLWRRRIYIYDILHTLKHLLYTTSQMAHMFNKPSWWSYTFLNIIFPDRSRCCTFKKKCLRKKNINNTCTHQDPKAAAVRPPAESKPLHSAPSSSCTPLNLAPRLRWWGRLCTVQLRWRRRWRGWRRKRSL